MSLAHKTLSQLVTLLESGETTSRQITDAYIEQINKRESEINAFTHKTLNLARKMADASDSRRLAGQTLSPLDGIPITLKDVICNEHAPITAASNILKDFQAPYNATVWQRLKDAGCVLLGIVNTDEFTMGSSTETSAYGVTKNPINPEHVPGGSSGGSAAAVAAHFCAGSVGTDTGGSIRQPAHFCGITGLKVSYGRVSRWGTIPMASSLDSVGPMAHTAEDCAHMLQIMAGMDPKDSTTPDIEVPNYLEALKQSIRGLKIGIPKEYMINGLSEETVQTVNAAKVLLESLGAQVTEVSLPHSKYALPAYYVIAPSEISANMSRYDGIRFGQSAGEKDLEAIYTETREKGLGDEVKRRILIGTYALSAGYYDAYYRKAQKIRTLICQDFEKAFEEVDVILGPVSPSPAFKIGEKTGNPLEMYLEDIVSIPANLAGICGMALPVSKSQNNLPIGVQLLGPAFKEERVLNVAHQMQIAMQ